MDAIESLKALTDVFERETGFSKECADALERILTDGTLPRVYKASIEQRIRWIRGTVTSNEAHLGEMRALLRMMEMLIEMTGVDADALVAEMDRNGAVPPREEVDRWTPPIPTKGSSLASSAAVSRRPRVGRTAAIGTRSGHGTSLTSDARRTGPDAPRMTPRWRSRHVSEEDTDACHLLPRRTVQHDLHGRCESAQDPGVGA